MANSTGATQSLGNNANVTLNKPDKPSGSTGAKGAQSSKGGKSPLKGLFAALRASKEHKAYKALGEAKGNGSNQKATLADEAVEGDSRKGSTAKTDPKSTGFNPKGHKPNVNRSSSSKR